MALFAPDEYAWRLFLALNWPSVGQGCGPDTGKAFGAEGPVVWEHWPSKNDVYLPKGAKPKSWTEICEAALVAKVLQPSAQLELAEQSIPKSLEPMFEPPIGDVSTARDEEVRLNQGALAFIIDSGTYSLTKQRALAASGVTAIDFPRAAKEIKAHWVVLPDAADHSRYHIGKTADGTVYGLVALHITTKDLPRWFWATFEHVDNETRWPRQYPTEFAGWTIPPRDAYSCPGGTTGCPGFPQGLGLEGTKWQFYRLKATQTDWLDLIGDPTLVVNSKIEGGFIPSQSSCISCHSLALIGETGPAMPFQIFKVEEVDDMGRVANFIGVVAPKDRRPRPGVDPNGKFLQLDFVWSLRNAKPEE
jgi:hypothetical protein